MKRMTGYFVWLTLASLAGIVWADDRPEWLTEKLGKKTITLPVDRTLNTEAVKTPSPVAEPKKEATTDEGRIGMYLDSGQAKAAEDLLKSNGVTISDEPQKARAFPAFAPAVGLFKWGQTPDYKLDDLKKLDAAVPMVLRFCDESPEANKTLADFVVASTARTFVLVCDKGVGPDMARALACKNVLYAVLGVGAGENQKPDEYQAVADRVDALRGLLGRISETPLVLAVDYANYRAGWIQRLGQRIEERLKKFDGYAITNAHNFTLFATQTRATICQAVGIDARKPVVLLDFLGTRGGETQRTAAVWAAKGKIFAALIQKQGWAGITFHCANLKDATFKTKIAATCFATKETDK